MSKAVKTPTVIVVSPATAAYDTAVRLTEKCGSIIAVGYPHGPLPLDLLSMILEEKSLISKWTWNTRLINGPDTSAATNQGTKQELQECLEIAAAKGIRCVIQVRLSLRS